MDFPAEIESLPKMLSLIIEAAKRDNVSESARKKLELSCEEALVNIITHAYPEAEGKIEINCIGGQNRFEVHIVDNGAPFNPIEKEVKINKSAPIHQRKIGGLGIFLFRELMDEIHYHRHLHQNHLTLVVRVI